MEGQPQAPPAVVGGRREPSIDPVKAQGVLESVNKKNKYAALLWPQRWSFYKHIPEMQEEEALKLGLSLEEYRSAVRSVSCTLAPQKYPVVVDPSPHPIPPTSAAIVGRRATCPLERYGRLVKTARDYPTRPPLKPGQIYDPYKQTLVFLGSVDGDPISYKLAPSRCEVPDELWTQPMQLAITPFEVLERI